MENSSLKLEVLVFMGFLKRKFEKHRTEKNLHVLSRFSDQQTAQYFAPLSQRGTSSSRTISEVKFINKPNSPIMAAHPEGVLLASEESPPFFLGASDPSQVQAKLFSLNETGRDTTQWLGKYKAADAILIAEETGYEDMLRKAYIRATTSGGTAVDLKVAARTPLDVVSTHVEGTTCLL